MASNTASIKAKKLLVDREYQQAILAFDDLLIESPNDHTLKLLRGKAKVELARQVQVYNLAVSGLDDLSAAFEVAHKARGQDESILMDCRIAQLRALAMLERFEELKTLPSRDAAFLAAVKRHEPGLASRIESASKRIRELAQAKNLRDGGNQFLAAAKGAAGGEVPARIVTFNRAMAQYEASVKTSDLLSVKSSALRNTGVTFQELAILHMTAYPGTAAQNTVKNYFEKAIINYSSNALSVGKAIQPPEWTDRVLNQMQTCIDAMMAFMHETFEDMLPRFQCYHSVATQSSGHARVLMSFHAGSLLFHIHCGEPSSEKDDASDYDAGINSLIARISNLERAAASLRFALDIDLTFEPNQAELIADVREKSADALGSVLLHLTALEAEKALFQGDDRLQSATNDEEELDVDLIMDALDKYILAIRIASDGADLETEAIACARVADLFDRVLKNLNKAHDFAKRSLEAALACWPRTFDDRSWFKLSRTIVKRFQEYIIAEENKAKAEERKPFMEELKPHLEELKTKREEPGQPKTFLKFIYEKYPPGPSKTQDGAHWDEADKTKTILVKALLHFHPDKTPKGTDQRTAILREEITKLLNNLYEVLVKGNA